MLKASDNKRGVFPQTDCRRAAMFLGTEPLDTLQNWLTRWEMIRTFTTVLNE